MTDNDRSSQHTADERAEEVTRRIQRKILLSPEQRRKERREELERKILVQPERMSEEARKRGALRYFLRCFRQVQPNLLAELRKILSEPLPIHRRIESLLSLIDRYDIPKSPAVIMECLKTLLMWQAFPTLPDVWHFEVPEGTL